MPSTFLSGQCRNNTQVIKNVRLSEGGGPERMGPRPPPWVPLLKNPIMVAVSFPPV